MSASWRPLWTRIGIDRVVVGAWQKVRTSGVPRHRPRAHRMGAICVRAGCRERRGGAGIRRENSTSHWTARFLTESKHHARPAVMRIGYWPAYRDNRTAIRKSHVARAHTARRRHLITVLSRTGSRTGGAVSAAFPMRHRRMNSACHCDFPMGEIARPLGTAHQTVTQNCRSRHDHAHRTGVRTDDAVSRIFRKFDQRRARHHFPFAITVPFPRVRSGRTSRSAHTTPLTCMDTLAANISGT
jgi:hypothetical protein